MIFDLLVEWALCYSIKVIEWTREFILHPTIALVAVYQYNARARHFGFLHVSRSSERITCSSLLCRLDQLQLVLDELVVVRTFTLGCQQFDKDAFVSLILQYSVVLLLQKEDARAPPALP